MKRTLILLMALLTLTTGCNRDIDTLDTKETGSETEEVTMENTNPNLLFEDNFDGTELDDTKWDRCPEWNRQGDLNVWDNTMSYLDGDGHLILHAEWNETDGKLHSGAVRTFGKFSEDFAYYEASVKFPPAHGIWGSFWIMAGNVASEENGAADGVEIDVIESIEGDIDFCNHALHWDGYGEAHKNASFKSPLFGIYDDEFHTFGLWRTEDAYIFYIDGEETWRVTAEECEICPEAGYMKLTLEGAAWAGLGSAESMESLPADMVVDYVRVYREKP